MARMLRENESTAAHLEAVRRHNRLCRKTQGAEKFAARIEPAFRELSNKHALTKTELEKRQDALDDVMLCDAALDNSVRTCFEKCQQFDRDHISETVLKKVFPEEKFGPIVKMPYTDEPTEVEKVVIRIESLGTEHPLYPLAADLREKVAVSKNAINQYFDAIRQHKLTEADEEIAKARLRQQYEINYLDARKEFGRINAEQIFPVLGGANKAEVAPEPETQPVEGVN